MSLNEFLYEVYEQMDIAASKGNALLHHDLFVLSERIKKELGIETPNSSNDGIGEADLFFQS